MKYRPPLQAIYSHFPLGIYTKRNYSVLGSFRYEANIQDEIIYSTAWLPLRNKQFLPREHIYISERNEKKKSIMHHIHSRRHSCNLVDEVHGGRLSTQADRSEPGSEQGGHLSTCSSAAGWRTTLHSPDNEITSTGTKKSQLYSPPLVMVGVNDRTATMLYER